MPFLQALWKTELGFHFTWSSNFFKIFLSFWSAKQCSSLLHRVACWDRNEGTLLAGHAASCSPWMAGQAQGHWVWYWQWSITATRKGAEQGFTINFCHTCTIICLDGCSTIFCALSPESFIAVPQMWLQWVIGDFSCNFNTHHPIFLV